MIDLDLLSFFPFLHKWVQYPDRVIRWSTTVIEQNRTEIESVKGHAGMIIVLKQNRTILYKTLIDELQVDTEPSRIYM